MITTQTGSRHRRLGRLACVLSIVFAALEVAPGLANAKEGKPWSEVQALGTTQNGSSLGASGSNVYVAYGVSPVYIRRSTDEGATFSAPAVLSDHGVIHETDSIAAQGNDAFVITFAPRASQRDWCCDRDIGNLVLHRSTDAGASWLHAVPLTTSGAAFRVSIAVSLPFVHVAWSDFRDGHWAIYYRRSTDNGSSWEPERRIVAPELEETNRPQLAVLGEAVHLVWDDNRDGNGACYTLPHCTETYYMRSLDAGTTWSAARRMTFNRSEKPLLSGRPEVATFADGAVVISYDQDLKFGQSGVQHLLRSVDRGETWQAPLQIGRKPEETHPAAAALGSDGIVAWFEQRFGQNGGVFARLTRDSGATWTQTERLSLPQGGSTPHVAFTHGFMHIIWLEGQGGAWRLSYRRRALSAGLPARR